MASNSQPLNIQLLDVDKFIAAKGCLEVTSELIHESSSSDWKADGLFSETIFGAVASDERMLKFGYITLNCRVFHPVIFQNLQSLKRFYVEIMSGRSYAKWDAELKDFVRAAETEEGSDTGFAFFLKYYPLIDLQKNKSLKRNDKINVLLKYRDIQFIDKMLVIPAGIRDMKEDEGRVEKDSINSLYASLLRSAKAMPPKGDSDPIYDTIHYSVQRKVMEIYEYLENLVEGKRGFLQGKLSYRHVVGSTRNVIAATNLECSDPESPQYHKCDESKIPLYQAAKGYSSLVVYHLRSKFYANVIEQSSDAIALINPDNYSLEYVQIDPKDKDALLNEEGIQKTIDRFRDPEYRFKPVTAKSSGKPFFLYLVYDDENVVYIFRNLNEFKLDMGEKFDPSKVRPLSYGEMLYIATYFASKDRSGLITRYPVTGPESTYPCRTHLVTTVPARIVTLATSAREPEGILLPEYPTLGAKFIDAVRLHPAKLKGLGADFDGDTISWHPIYSEEASKECDAYYEDIKSFVWPDGSPMTDVDDLCGITMHAMTVSCPELTKLQGKEIKK